MSSPTNTKYDYIIVLDFESTCWNNKGRDPERKPDDANEIIEFPSVVIDLTSGKPTVTDEIQQFVKPKHNPKLSKFCKKLTSITQEQVNSGVSFGEAFKAHREFIKRYPNSILLTCGDWDLGTMLPSDAEFNNQRIPAYYKKWINIKKEFNSYFYKNLSSMTDMLEFLGLKLEGTHHRGIDDCKNIARVAIEMMNRGWKPGSATR